MRWIDESWIIASLLSVRRSWSRPSRRLRISQAKVRSTTHRFGKSTKPFPSGHRGLVASTQAFKEVVMVLRVSPDDLQPRAPHRVQPPTLRSVATGRLHGRATEATHRRDAAAAEAKPGSPCRVDYEDVREGVCTVHGRS